MKTAPGDLSQSEREKIFEYLEKHPVGVLSSVDEDGRPNASPIYFAVDSDLNVTFMTKRDTHKHQNLQRNGYVMLVAYEAQDQSAVQLSGPAVEITDPVAAQQIFYGTLKAAEQTGKDAVPPVAKYSAGPYVAYIIKPENIWMNEYGRGDSFANAMKHANDPPSTGDPA